jgi:hypothetical protein
VLKPEAVFGVEFDTGIKSNYGAKAPSNNIANWSFDVERMKRQHLQGALAQAPEEEDEYDDGDY